MAIPWSQIPAGFRSSPGATGRGLADAETGGVDVGGGSCAGCGMDGLAVPAHPQLADGAGAVRRELLLNSLAAGWVGAKESLLGAGLGLGLLLPFVLLRSLGAGDWKLVGALGAFLGPSRLITVLLGTILVAGLMARGAGHLEEAGGADGRAISAHMVAGLFTLHLPGPEVSLDNPESLKIPFGVAVAVTVVLYTVGQAWGVV